MAVRQELGAIPGDAVGGQGQGSGTGAPGIHRVTQGSPTHTGGTSTSPHMNFLVANLNLNDSDTAVQLVPLLLLLR